ncbi:MAG: DUF6442 family protein [Defluviitaleaceae bacterium]|nr:DUF6442 family protein [Defluviitaleaceae bacterium]
MSSSIKNNRNRKEDILERNRKSSKDEGLDYTKKQGYRIGYYAFGVMGIALVVFSIHTDQMTVIFALTSVVFAFSFGEMLAHYLFTKNMSYTMAQLFSLSFLLPKPITS